MTHFTRLIDLTSADETYVINLAQTLAPCILRPRTENALTMEERHPYRLIRDLFDHKEAIFGELKRQSSTLGGASVTSARQRAVSTTDESSRRANMEARAKAITEQRQRDKSPGPGNRHRRDRSTDGSMGRFPVVATPRTDSHGRSVSGIGMPYKRSSLEVPGSSENSPVQTRTDTPTRLTAPRLETFTASKTAPDAATNGHQSKFTRDEEPARPSSAHGSLNMPGAFTGHGPGPHIPPPVDDDSPATESVQSVSTPVQEQDSVPKPGPLKRTSMGSGVKRSNRAGAGSMKNKSSLGGVGEMTAAMAERGPVGVELRDEPMNMDDFS